MDAHLARAHRTGDWRRTLRTLPRGHASAGASSGRCIPLSGEPSGARTADSAGTAARGDAAGDGRRNARDGDVEVLCDAEGFAGGRVQAECAWCRVGDGWVCVCYGGSCEERMEEWRGESLGVAAPELAYRDGFDSAKLRSFWHEGSAMPCSNHSLNILRLRDPATSLMPCS